MKETLIQWATKQPIIRGIDPQTNGVLDRKPRPGHPEDGGDFTMYRRWEFVSPGLAAKAVAFVSKLVGYDVDFYEDINYESTMDPTEKRRRYLYQIPVPENLQPKIGTDTLEKPVGTLIGVIFQKNMDAKGHLEWLDEPDSSGQIFRFMEDKEEIPVAFRLGPAPPGYKWGRQTLMGPDVLIPE